MAKKPNNAPKLSLTEKFKRSKFSDVFEDVLIAAPIIDDIICLGNEASKALSTLVGAQSLRTHKTPVNIKTNFMTKNVAGQLVLKQKNGWFQTIDPINDTIQDDIFTYNEKTFKAKYGDIKNISFLKNDLLIAQTVKMPMAHPSPLLKAKNFKPVFIDRFINALKNPQNSSVSAPIQELQVALEKAVSETIKVEDTDNCLQLFQTLKTYNKGHDLETLRSDLLSCDTAFLYTITKDCLNLNIDLIPTDFVIHCPDFDKGISKMDAVQSDDTTSFQSLYLRPEYVDSHKTHFKGFDDFEDLQIQLAILSNHSEISKNNDAHNWLKRKYKNLHSQLNGLEAPRFSANVIKRKLSQIQDSFKSVQSTRQEDKKNFSQKFSSRFINNKKP